jgi:ADP-ribose pyrophosphatase
MRLEKLTKVHDGKYLKNYELTYINKAGREKKYEIVSRRELSGVEDLGKKTSGVSIIAWKEDKLLLLREYRMAVNKEIFNLCAGMIEDGETMEECIRRELYEETGLSVARIHAILPPSYSAVGISDIRTNLAFVEVKGEISDHTSDNESIKAAFYSKEQLKELLAAEEFSSRSQLAAYSFLSGNPYIK